MTTSRHYPLYSHLLTCEQCRISDRTFCAEAGAMGNDYVTHLDGFGAKRRIDAHEAFVSAVVRGRIKQGSSQRN